MKKEDFSALLVEILQRITEGKGVDVRHDTLFSRKKVLERVDISRHTLDKALEKGDFPPPIKIAGQERWPSSVINDYIRQTNSQLQEKNELMVQAARALKGEKA